MNRFACFCRGAALGVLAAVVGACSGNAGSGGDQATAQSKTAQSPWLAIARGRVDVEGGLVRIVATRDGVITAVKAQDGDAVKAGQVLAELDPRAAQIGVAEAQAAVEQARAQAAELKVKLHAAQQRAPRLAAAARAGAATGDAADQARNAVAALKAQSDAARAQIDAARQHLAAAHYELDTRTLRAPLAGRVVRRVAQVGQSVSAQAGLMLFELLPDRPRIVRAELEAEAADRVTPGMRVEVVRDTGEGPVYPARVLRVGEVLGAATLSDDPLQRAAAREVECVLQLDGSPASPSGARPPELRIGQRVLVRFPR